MVIHHDRDLVARLCRIYELRSQRRLRPGHEPGHDHAAGIELVAHPQHGERHDDQYGEGPDKDGQAHAGTICGAVIDTQCLFERCAQPA